MSTPAGDNAFLHELELNVRKELILAETSPSDRDRDGEPTLEWLLDVDAERYEVSLHSLLGAVETMENGSRPGGGPPPAA
jgi:hypothetical protein